MAPFKTSILQSERLFPKTKLDSEQTIALSLLDATTVNFAPTCLSWLCEAPENTTGCGEDFSLADHLRQSLRVALDAYPQWSGQITAITTIDSTAGPSFPSASSSSSSRPHAQRFGRVHVHYGTSQDAGVEFTVADSTATLGALYPASRATDKPAWNRQEIPLDEFIPSIALSNALQPATESTSADDGRVVSLLPPPLLVVQLTNLACGGFVLTVKCAHPLADIQSLVYFVKDWASVSRSVLSNTPCPALKPQFEPGLLDSLAAGDIDAIEADTAIIQKTKSMPLHRYDWWAPSPGAPWPVKVPDGLACKTISPAGKPMPWSEWNVAEPVSHYVVHFNRRQVEAVSRAATATGLSQGTGAVQTRTSQHDAILAHVWSCINRARKLEDDKGDNRPVHCDLVYGVRPAFKLDKSFMGSPIIMVNVEMSASKPPALQAIAQRIRQTITDISQPDLLAAHLHSVAYEESPQRIWQAFLGRRHILVTTWARAGIYEVDFGFSSSSAPSIRYAEGVVPDMDGNVLIKEAPPLKKTDLSDGRSSWTADGVDVSLRLRAEDMDRLLQDPLLFPLYE
ncbi:transferase [Nannizzia gypsea CBS 118893]|uniref:Transferase n=1 Tax=Arthroderma gypseum (strain ATCC MYA-4604 / CBS 118893) TaxID=535722 RepID=E4V5V0_ARTGP|nr:transferase [Nannizzia gypsea CBS 118893]EFR05475.1 transferase [Nannizzia gypsea CBS 118893]